MNTINNNSPKLVIGFGKGRLFTDTLNNFNFISTPAFQEFVTKKMLQYEDPYNDTTNVIVRHSDLPYLLKNKHINVAVGSSLWFLNDASTSLQKAFTLTTKKYHLALIAKKGMNLNNIQKVATRFEHIAQKYFDNKNKKVKLIKMDGCHEIALTLGFADAIIDVVETGETIKRMNFQQLELIYDLHHEIWLRADENFEKNINTLKHLLSPIALPINKLQPQR